jgi:hypothetical protein
VKAIFFLQRGGACLTFPAVGSTFITGFGYRIWEVIFFGGASGMSDQRNVRKPNPHLQTRPATMLTAIGLCVLIMLMHLLPNFQDTGSRPPSATTASVR